MQNQWNSLTMCNWLKWNCWTVWQPNSLSNRHLRSLIVNEYMVLFSPFLLLNNEQNKSIVAVIQSLFYVWYNTILTAQIYWLTQIIIIDINYYFRPSFVHSVHNRLSLRWLVKVSFQRGTHLSVMMAWRVA